MLNIPNLARDSLIPVRKYCSRFELLKFLFTYNQLKCATPGRLQLLSVRLKKFPKPIWKNMSGMEITKNNSVSTNSIQNREIKEEIKLPLWKTKNFFSSLFFQRTYDLKLVL